MRIRQILSFAILPLVCSVNLYAELPSCSEKIVREVTKRAGCGVGEADCWLARRGYCMDFVEKMIRNRKSGKIRALKHRIKQEEARPGDVAIFLSRPHTAYVEGAVKDKRGRTISVNLAEFNYGTCWIDRANLVTENYGIVSRRSGVPIHDVDGGFMRP